MRNTPGLRSPRPPATLRCYFFTRACYFYFFVLFFFVYPQGVISKSPLLFHKQIPAEVISSESVAPEPKLNIPVFIRSRLKHCRGSRSQRRARLVQEDIRRVLFPVPRIENPCCVLFNPSAPAVSEVHRRCIFSVADKQPGQLPSSLCPRCS